MLKATKTVGSSAKTTRRFADLLNDNRAMLDTPRLMASLHTAGQRAKAVQLLSRVDGNKLRAADGHHGELAELVLKNGNDGVRLINEMDYWDVRRLFKMDVRGTNANMKNVRQSLFELNRRGDISAEEVNTFTRRVDEFDDTKGIDDVLESMSSDGTSYTNYKGAKFEMGYAKKLENDRYEIDEFQANNNVNKPGDIDILTEKNGKKVGFETKNIDFAEKSFQELKKEFGQITRGSKDMVKGGEVDEYKIVFSEELPDEFEKYLQSRIGSDNNVDYLDSQG